MPDADAPQVEPLTLTLEEAIVELAKHDRLSLRCFPARFGVPTEWAALSPEGWVCGSGDAWHEAVSEALGRPVVPRDPTAELVVALDAWQQWAERWGDDIMGSLSVSPEAHDELLQRLEGGYRAYAALARVKGGA